MDKLTDHDKETLVGLLKQLKADGKPALIPLDVDLDGDGICDAWGLEDDGESLTLVSGATLADTAYVSDGHDIAQAS